MPTLYSTATRDPGPCPNPGPDACMAFWPPGAAGDALPDALRDV